jgi:hypothetical protein
MCSMYWTLENVEFTCPKCGTEGTAHLQTHFMGEALSCLNYYSMGEKIPELGDMTVTLRPLDKETYLDDFTGKCEACNTWVDFGGNIVNGTVTEVWPIPL